MNTKMIKNICLFTILGIAALFTSCSKDPHTVNFTPDVQIQFAEGGDSSIVNVGKDVMEYTVKVDVSSKGKIIRLFEIYTADATTGARGDLIPGTTEIFEDGEGSYSTTYTVSGLTENKAIKVVVTDTLERAYEKNILVKITPSVHFSSLVRLETADNLYGSYYATWLSGRAYMRDTEYSKEVDVSLGEVVIPSEGISKVPALVNPSKRGDYGLPTVNGLQDTKFALTTLTPAEYSAITRVNGSVITSLADPTEDAVLLQAGSVYVFKTANGRKGLIHVTSRTAKTGTIENADGQWEELVTYHELTLTTKTIL